MKGRGISEEERRQREKEERSREKLQEQAYREAQRGVYTRIYQEQNAMPSDAQEAFRDAPRQKGSPRRDWEDTIPRRGSGGGKTGQGSGGEKNRPLPETQPDKPKKNRKRTILIVVLVLVALVVTALAVHSIFVHAPDLPDATSTQEDGTDPGTLGAGRREDVYTFLLVGRDDGGGGNTDTIMVGCFDVKNGTLDILSIYRDTLVDVPWEIRKINSVYNRQGIEGLLEQVRNLIGYTPDYYFVVELSAVTELVDALGGVDYEVPYNMDYDDPSQDLHIHFQAGMQHLDGSDAVKLLRWRKNNSGESLSVGDVGRVEIQHSFLTAMAKQAVSLGNVTKVKKIASIVDKNLTSNLSYGEMLWFGEKALGMSGDNIQFHSLPGDYNGTIWSSTYQNYQSYVFVNADALLEMVNQYMNPYTTPLTSDMQHVIYGTTVNDQATLPSGGGTSATSDTASTQEDSPTGGQTVTQRQTTSTDSTTTTNKTTNTNTNTNTSTPSSNQTGEPSGEETTVQPTEPSAPETPAQTGGESQEPTDASSGGEDGGQPAPTSGGEGTSPQQEPLTEQEAAPAPQEP